MIILEDLPIDCLYNIFFCLGFKDLLILRLSNKVINSLILSGELWKIRSTKDFGMSMSKFKCDELHPIKKYYVQFLFHENLDPVSLLIESCKNGDTNFVKYIITLSKYYHYEWTINLEEILNYESFKHRYEICSFVAKNIILNDEHHKLQDILFKLIKRGSDNSFSLYKDMYNINHRDPISGNTILHSILIKVSHIYGILLYDLSYKTRYQLNNYDTSYELIYSLTNISIRIIRDVNFIYDIRNYSNKTPLDSFKSSLCYNTKYISHEIVTKCEILFYDIIKEFTIRGCKIKDDDRKLIYRKGYYTLYRMLEDD